MARGSPRRSSPASGAVVIRPFSSNSPIFGSNHPVFDGYSPMFSRNSPMLGSNTFGERKHVLALVWLAATCVASCTKLTPVTFDEKGVERDARRLHSITCTVTAKLHLRVTSESYISELHLRVTSRSYISELHLGVTTESCISELQPRVTSQSYSWELHLRVTAESYSRGLHPRYISDPP